MILLELPFNFMWIKETSVDLTTIYNKEVARNKHWLYEFKCSQLDWTHF